MDILAVVKNVPQTIGKMGGRKLLVLKKHSPVILTAVGVAGFIGTTVLACKATLKVEDILDEHEEQMSVIKEAAESEDRENYTDKDAKKDKATVMFVTGIKIAKVYTPAVILGAASMACVLGAQGIMSKRNTALAAAYSLVDGQLKEYRNRVIDELGAEADKRFLYGLDSEEIKVKEIDEETGKAKTVKKTVNTVSDGFSIYAKCFDDASEYWVNDADMNKSFLWSAQNQFNDRLRMKGHVFLNEVYDALGLPRTSEGQIVGWVWNDGGDNYIDFGIYRIGDQGSQDFVNGYEKSIFLDFNVDGVIYDKI